MLDLRDRGAIIVGARRIGRVVVERLVREGIQPAIVYRKSRDEAQAVLDEVSPVAPRACLIQADLTVEADVARLVDTAREELGDLSFCVNLASDYPRATLAQLDEPAWERGLAAAKGAYLLAAHAGRAFMANTAATRGHIIFFGDWAAEATPYRDYLPYLTGKAAIHFLTRGFARELAPHGILVNAISPGPTIKPPDMTDQEWDEVLTSAPLRRESSADEIAEIICTLLKLETVTGENIRVDSGKHIQGTS